MTVAVTVVLGVVTACAGGDDAAVDGVDDAAAPSPDAAADGSDPSEPADDPDVADPAACAALDELLATVEEQRLATVQVQTEDDQPTDVEVIAPLVAAQEALAATLGEDAAATLTEAWIAPSLETIEVLEETDGRRPDLATSEEFSAYHRDTPWLTDVLATPLLTEAALDELASCGASVGPLTTAVAATSSPVGAADGVPAEAVAAYAHDAFRAILFDGLHPCTAIHDAMVAHDADLVPEGYLTLGGWFSQLTLACSARTPDDALVWVGVELVGPEYHASVWSEATPTDAVPGGLEQQVDVIEYTRHDGEFPGPGPWHALASYDPLTGARVTVYTPDGVDPVAFHDVVTAVAEGGFDEAAHGPAVATGDGDGSDGGGSDDAAARAAWEAQPCAEFDGSYGVVAGGELYTFGDPTSCLAGMVELGLMSPEEFAERAG